MTAPGVPPLTALAALLGRIAQIMQAGDDPAARTAAAASVDELRALVGDTATGGVGASPAGGIGASPTGGVGATSSGGPPGFDLAQITDALAVFAEWLRAPTRDSEARAEHAMSELQAALGPLIGWNPAREDAERRAQYRREASAALDNLFPDGLGAPGKPKH